MFVGAASRRDIIPKSPIYRGGTPLPQLRITVDSVKGMINAI
jgi:hypothetical protein